MAGENSESGTTKGVVKWFNNAKGFGFIQHTDGKDVFVHYSVIVQDGYKSLKDGEEVEYEIKAGAKGYSATRVSRVGGAASAENSSTASAEATIADSEKSLADRVEKISY